MFGINKEEKKLKKELKPEKTLTSISGLTRLPDETHKEFVARVNEKCKTTQKENSKGAQEMYQYCIDNNFGMGLSKNWSIKHFLLIQKALQNDERVLMSFIGLHNYKSASKHDNNFAYAITNKRLILAQQQALGEVVQSINLDNINDVTKSSGILSGTITFDTIKEVFNVNVSSSAATAITNKIHEILYSQNTSAENHSPSSAYSPADEILKYKNLLDIGAITEEEYNQKKQELLQQ